MGGTGWAPACVAWAGCGAADLCSVPAPCCPLLSWRAARVEIAVHQGLEFHSRHSAARQHAPTAFKSCRMLAFSGATRLLVSPVLTSKGALRVGQERVVRQKDVWTSQSGDWTP